MPKMQKCKHVGMSNGRYQLQVSSQRQVGEMLQREGRSREGVLVEMD